MGGRVAIVQITMDRRLFNQTSLFEFQSKLPLFTHSIAGPNKQLIIWETSRIFHVNSLRCFLNNRRHFDDLFVNGIKGGSFKCGTLEGDLTNGFHQHQCDEGEIKSHLIGVEFMRTHAISEEVALIFFDVVFDINATTIDCAIDLARAAK